MINFLNAPWETFSSRLLALRYKVFVEEQNIPQNLEIDEWDPVSIHIILQFNDIDIGTARFLPAGYIGRVCILKEFRGKNFGKLLMNHLIEMAKSLNYDEINLSSQVSVENFYKKLGFQTISPIYEEVGIPHVKMLLKLNKD